MVCLVGATAPEPSSSSGGGAVAATAAVAVEAAIVAAATAEIQREMVERPKICNEFAILVSGGFHLYLFPFKFPFNYISI